MDLDLRGPAGARAYPLLTNLVVPRPIAWVTSLNDQGVVNLAPFSFFNLIGSDPPLVVISVGQGSDGQPKHTAQNIAARREFVVNLVTEELASAMNLTAADFPQGYSEVQAAGLHTAPSTQLATPRVAQAKASLECTLHSLERIGSNHVIIARVIALHVADDIVDPEFRVRGFTPLGRMGAPAWYTRTTDRLEIKRISFAEWQASRK